MIAEKEFKRWQKVNSNCDHTKLTETLDNMNCCFCAKLMSVISINNRCSLMDFSNQFRDVRFREMVLNGELGTDNA